MGYVIEFKKVFVKCTVPGCPRKHYAKGYCENHYHQNCRGAYRFNCEQFINYRVDQRKKSTSLKKIETSIIGKDIKNKTAKKLYQKLIDANISDFQYKDVMNLTEWKYEKIKKYILLLVKLRKIYPTGEHSGGKQAVFKISV